MDLAPLTFPIQFLLEDGSFGALFGSIKGGVGRSEGDHPQTGNDPGFRVLSFLYCTPIAMAAAADVLLLRRSERLASLLLRPAGRCWAPSLGR